MLVAPLNWGLGHATRCIPIIQALLKSGFEPVLASDGEALVLLQKEFPFLKSYTLPSYHIKYTKSSKNLKLLLLFSVPSIFLAVKKEQKVVDEIIEKEQIVGVISDNRFGVYSKKLPSIYITHQLHVLSGNTTFMTSIFHQKIWTKFDECWIPDVATTPNLSGKLGHLQNKKFNLKYIGALSRLSYFKTDSKYDLLVLLSGPEPQRTILENKLLKELENYNGSVLFVRGDLKNSSTIKTTENIIVKDYLLTHDLEKAINESKLVLARSGYSTIMDLAVLGKKAFFIPTPGQFEQEYLAKKLSKENVAPFSTQEKFQIEDLKKVKSFNGFNTSMSEVDLNLFGLFQGK